MQRLVSGPLTSHLPRGWDLWLDGGHNPSAGEAVAAWLADEPELTVAICGMMAGKDIKGYFKPLVPYLEALATVLIPHHEGCAAADVLMHHAQDAGIKDVISCTDLSAAFAALQPHLSASRGRVLICGSLYLSGEVLKTHG